MPVKIPEIIKKLARAQSKAAILTCEALQNLRLRLILTLGEARLAKYE